MIKVGIINPTKGRNEPTFRPFLLYQSLFKEVGIEFVDDSHSIDFFFVGMNEFIDKKIPLQQSIDKGVEFLSTLKVPYFLFDGSDSTSLMGSIEVFRKSNPIYLFKNQLLDFEEYNEPSTFNKWFFGSKDQPLLSYNLSDEERRRIKLSGFNLGTLLPQYRQIKHFSEDRSIDVCSIFQTTHKENYDHTFRNDLLYTNHRTVCKNKVVNLKNYSYIVDRKPYNEFIDILKRSKYTLSPFGMGEVCFRDFECMMYGSLLLKPTMEKVRTIPNIYIPYETYIPLEIDYSDLEDKLNWLEQHPNKRLEMVHRLSEIFIEKSSPIELVRYWYDIFKGLDTITTQ